MVTGRFFAVILSVLLHATLLLIISYTVTVPNKETNPPIAKPQTIKSFLYTPPKKVPEVKPQTQAKIEPEVEEPQPKIEQLTTIEKITKVEKELKVEEKRKEPEIGQENPKEAPTDNSSKMDNTAQSKPSTVNSFSALRQLNRLKQGIDAQILDEIHDDYRRRKSASVLDGVPESVPHSSKQLSNEEIKENATYQLSDGMKTIKGDDGSCSIERDLSAVGIEGVKSVESFNCGTSKFDKSFSEHMKKVQKKLGK